MLTISVLRGTPYTELDLCQVTFSQGTKLLASSYLEKVRCLLRSQVQLVLCSQFFSAGPRFPEKKSVISCICCDLTESIIIAYCAAYVKKERHSDLMSACSRLICLQKVLFFFITLTKQKVVLYHL